MTCGEGKGTQSSEVTDSEPGVREARGPLPRAGATLSRKGAPVARRGPQGGHGDKQGRGREARPPPPSQRRGPGRISAAWWYFSVPAWKVKENDGPVPWPPREEQVG